MTVDTLVAAPTRLPKVNLLPQEINEANRARQVKFALAAVVVASIGGMGFLTTNASSSVSNAQSSLDAAQSQTATLKASLAQHQGITTLKTQVATARSTLAAAMAQNVAWAWFLNDVQDGLPRGVRLLTWTSNLALAGAPGPAQTSFGSGGTATWLFTGEAKSYEDVAKLIESFQGIDAVDSVFTTSVKKTLDSSSKKTVYTFSLQARVNAKALTAYNPQVGG